MIFPIWPGWVFSTARARYILLFQFRAAPWYPSGRLASMHPGRPNGGCRTSVPGLSVSRPLSASSSGDSVMWQRTVARRSANPAGRARRIGECPRPNSIRRRPDVEPLEGRRLLATIVEYPLPAVTSGPFAIAPGPGGQMWFLEQGANQVASIDPVTHAISATPIPTAASYATSLAVGADGNIWFTEQRVGQLGVLDVKTDTIHEIPLSAVTADPMGITAGPDGRLWFAEEGSSMIASIDPIMGKIVEYPTPTPDSQPTSVAVGPNGNIWFTESKGNRIGEINPTTGQITEFPLPPGSAQPQSITAGPDGNLWFTVYGTGQIGKLNPTTGAITEFALPAAGARPWGIAAGPDGNIWFTESGSSQVGAIDPATGAITELTPPGRNTAPTGIAAGPDGNIWFTESMGASIGVVVLDPPPPVVDPLPSGTGGTEGSNGPTGPVLMSLQPASAGDPGPAIVGGQSIDIGKGRHRHFVGFQLALGASLNPAAAQDPANYLVLQQTRFHHRAVFRPVGFRIIHSQASGTVQLVLRGHPRFAWGGEIVFNPDGAVAVAQTLRAASPLAPGTVTLTILPHARGVVVAG
ncbi:MAG: Vgb family protein [Isosphaeraceae bacterium]